MSYRCRTCLVTVPADRICDARGSSPACIGRAVCCHTHARTDTHTHIQGLTETQTNRQTDREVAKRCQQQRPVGTAVGRMRTFAACANKPKL